LLADGGTQAPEKGADMTGLVVVAHFNLAKEMVAATELIVGKQKQFEAVGIFPDADVDTLKEKIVQALKKADSGDGVIILTDMFGGTPSNISLSFLEAGKVEVVAGVNLPMLIKLVTLREEKTLDELAGFITQYGQRNICLATDVLKARRKE
jgi:PTS system mannose-specific IIA component